VRPQPVVAAKECSEKAPPLQKAQEWGTQLQKQRDFKGKSAASPELQSRGDGSGVKTIRQTAWDGEAVRQTAWRGGWKKRLDIFPYGNIMLRHGEGSDHIGCV